MKHAFMLAVLTTAAPALATSPAAAPLAYRTGTVSLLGGKATLDTGSTLRYLDAAGARRVIVDEWGCLLYTSPSPRD